MHASSTPADAAPSTHVLTNAQIRGIHEGSLEVLENTGYHIPVAEVRDLLYAAGARVDGERVRIPAQVVEEALKPLRPITLFDRAGQPALPLAEGRVRFGGLADTFYVVDPHTRDPRPFLRDDQGWSARVLDALPNIEWIQVVGQAHDVPDRLQTQVAFLETVRQTTKPILVYPYDRDGLLDILDALTIIAGGEDVWRGRPFLACASVPAAPLYATDYNLELLLACAEHRVPLLYYSCPAIGGNSPCSLAGTLTLATADWLAALTIHQLKSPGAPVCSFGYTVQLMEMRTTMWSYEAPEMMLAYAAVADIARWYGLPAWGITMEPDTSHLDAQAGLEMSAACHWALLSGIDLVHNIGRVGAGKLLSAEAMVLADEMIGYGRAAVSPPRITPEMLAEGADLIREVGPMGEYVTCQHTLKHFRDFWYPHQFDRSQFDPCAQDTRPGLVERLNVRAREIIQTHNPIPLPDGIPMELQRLEQTWYDRLDSHRSRSQSHP